MKPREEITRASKSFFTENQVGLQLEVLLDIRDLLEALVRLQSPKD